MQKNFTLSVLNIIQPKYPNLFFEKIFILRMLIISRVNQENSC